MKRTFKYIIGITCSLAAVFSCARFDEQTSVPGKGEMESVVFSAVIEGGAQTKTVLGGEMGDEYRQVLWQPEDSVGICSSDWWYSGLNKFVNTEIEETQTASLSGEIDNGYGTYYAFYPYSSDLFYYDSAIIRFIQPSVQNYRRNSFNANAMPMIARAGRGEVFDFYSLCGVLAINLTGTETVKSISFSGQDESGNPIPLAGHFSVNMGYDTYPEMSVSTYGDSRYTVSSVTLDCGEGVALDPAQPTAFYIVLPVDTYNKFTVTINTSDGKLMLKEGTIPLEIKRANVTKAGTLAFVESVAFDLSEHGTANSYIVPEPGIYSFKANVIGNGGYGIIDGAGFHTENPYINPVKPVLLWEDRPGVINNLTSDDNKVSFVTGTQEGNALVGVTDEAGTLLWSWHIWVTDQPQEQTYVNGENRYVMLDRNLGGVRADRGDGEEWRDAVGLMYQWGRKDPFTFRYVGTTDYHGNKLYTTNSSTVSVETSIQNPTVFYGAGYYYWSESPNPSFWTTSQKTIYDPCPVGYVVPHRDVWKAFSKNDSYWNSSLDNFSVSGSFNKGFDFIYDGTNTTYYPIRSKIDHNGNLETYNSQHMSLWSSDANPAESYSVYYLAAYYYSYVDSWLYLDWTEYMTNAHGVRCMKDEGFVDAAKPLVKVVGSKDITVESATVEALVADEGSTSVVERGIIWGTDKNLENGNVVPAQQAGRGEFSVQITGLQASTKYYYKAYAKNAEYTSYSETKYFYTPYEGNVYNLSQEGTANCYIVPPVYGEYAFNASVKGNSKESVGQIASAEVLWETRMTYDDIAVGDIINEVSIEGNNVHFILDPEVKPGNALIAVKDADGTILWSWHIWVVDFDPVETQQTLSSGAVIMDRNLGATGVVPGSLESYGFYYQWGRKDPFVIPGYMTTAPADAITYEYYDSSNDTIENAVSHPTVVYNDAQWNYVDDLWDSSKTKYDPCPAGWRVSDPSAWTDIRRADNSQDGYFQLSHASASPTAYIPAAGRTDGDINVSDYKCAGFIWLSERNANMYFWVWNDDGFQNGQYGADNLMSVRCMKITDMEFGDNEGYTGSDYEW